MRIITKKKLREEIKGIREERDYLFNKLSIENKYLSQENQQLQNNWNELKSFLEEKMSVYEHKEASNFYVVFEKMQELQGDDKN